MAVLRVKLRHVPVDVGHDSVARPFGLTALESDVEIRRHLDEMIVKDFAGFGEFDVDGIHEDNLPWLGLIHLS